MANSLPLFSLFLYFPWRQNPFKVLYSLSLRLTPPPVRPSDAAEVVVAIAHIEHFLCASLFHILSARETALRRTKNQLSLCFVFYFGMKKLLIES